jgi:SAM-dependent methyltransferase
MRRLAHASPERLRHEQAFHREIAPRAEVVWNWASPSGRQRAARRAGFFVEALAGRPEARALELGVGSGVFLEPVVASGAAVVALDLSTELIQQAREKVRATGRARFCCGNAERLPFPDQTFDLVYGSSILHHLDLPTAARELLRVLRPGGRFVFAEPNAINPQIALTFRVLPRSWSGLSPDEQAFSRFRARRVLGDAGFVDVASEPYDFLHPFVPAPLVGLVERLSLGLERVPLLREIAGSQIIRARRP